MSLGKRYDYENKIFHKYDREAGEVKKKNYDCCSGSCCDFCGDCDSFRFGADTGINLRNRNDLP